MIRRLALLAAVASVVAASTGGTAGAAGPLCVTVKPGSHPDWQMLEYNNVNNTIPVGVDPAYTDLIGGGPVYGYRILWVPRGGVIGGRNLGANLEVLVPDNQLNIPWNC